MWIRTQDKKRIANINGVYVSKNIGGKAKAALTGYSLGLENISGTINCGFYADENKALDELDRFEQFISEKTDGVYQFN